MKYLKPLTFIPMLLMMCLIFSFSSQDGEESGSLSYTISLRITETGNQILHLDYDQMQIEEHAKKIEHPVRKLAHMSEYFILALTVCLPLYMYRLRGLRLFVAALVICAAFAGSDEFHQSFVSGRGPSIKDVGIDTIGAALASALASLPKRKH